MKKTDDARRKLLKTVTGAGGIVAIGITMPETWVKPAVDSILLPAHAQMTNNGMTQIDPPS